MNNLSVGFARVNINPELGTPVAGYYISRFAKGFLDDLYVRAIAVADEEKTVLIINVDFCGRYSVTSPPFAEYTAINDELVYTGTPPSAYLKILAYS